MTTSTEKVIDDTMEAASMVMLTDDPQLFDKLIKPAINKAVDTLYDYLSNPDETEIEALQTKFGPVLEGLKEIPFEQLMAAQNKPIVMTEGMKAPMLAFTKAMASLQSETSPRLKAAFEDVSGGISFNDNMTITMARLDHAIKTDTLSELIDMQRQTSNKLTQDQIIGLMDFVTSDKVVPFMQALARNLNKDDFKAVTYYAAQTFQSISNEFLSDDTFEGMDNGDSSLGSQMKDLSALQEKMAVGIFKNITPTQEAAGIFGRLVQAFEASALDSGAMTEEQYTDFAKERVQAGLKVMRGYDAMNGFDAQRALGATTSARHGGPKAP